MWLGVSERSELEPRHMRNSLEKVGSSRSPIRFYGNFNKEKNKMAHRNNDNKLDAVMEMLIENGFESFADVLRILLNEAMKIERDQALCAQLYERTQERRGYANGYKPKAVDTRIGWLNTLSREV